MADYTPNMTGTTALGDSVIADYSATFTVAARQENVIDSFVSDKRVINATSIQIPKVGKLAVITSATPELQETDSVALSDTKVTITPLTYSNVVTQEDTIEIVTGGMAGRMAVSEIGANMMESRNALGTLALEASTNVIFQGQTSRAAITATDVLTSTSLNVVYNKLSRLNIKKVGGVYFMLAHDDVIHDLRTLSAAGDWIDVNKYINQVDLINNEMGMFKGFRVIRNNAAAIVTDGGVTTTDVYKTQFFGMGALALAESLAPTLTFKVDGKQDQFMHIGWRARLAYKILDQDALWSIESASSVGVNV